MKYIVNHPSKDIVKALGLDKDQVKRLDGAIRKAYITINPSKPDFSIDELNGLVSPYIRTAEEAFYVASIVLTDVLGTAMNMGINPLKP